MIFALAAFISVAASVREPVRLADATTECAGVLTVARSGDLDAAEVVARTALKVDPLHIPCRRLLDLIGDRRDSRVNEATFAAVLAGMALQDAGDRRGARNAYEQALEFQPDYYFALHNLGAVLYEDGDNDEAIALYERALAANADYPYTENNLGLALARADRAEAALPHYRTALRLYPDYHKAYHNLAQRDRILEVARAAGESVAYLGGGTALGDPREPDPWLAEMCAADVPPRP